MPAPVLLLHSMGSSHRMWRAQEAALGGKYDLVAPDLPGHGDTPGPFTLDGAVDHALAALGEREEPAHVVGVSLGANVALRILRTEPDRVASLLVSGAFVRAPRGVLGVQRIVTRLLPLTVTAAVSARVVHPADEGDRGALIEDTKRAGRRTQLDALRQLVETDFTTGLGTVGVPTLVCCGGDDRTNLASARLLAERVPDARLRVIPDAGHLWNLQRPRLCTEVVDEFVGGTR